MFNLVKWGVELKMNWLNWSIPISSGFQFQFNSNSKSFNSIPIQFMLNWIELIINSNSIHELIRALIDSHPFRSMSISPSIPEMQHFQNLILKIQGQGHGWGGHWKSQHRSNILSTHIPLIPCQSAIPFVRYNFYKIWPWKSKVKVMGEGNVESHKMGVTSYRLNPFHSMSIGPSNPEIQHLQNLTLKIQGQGQMTMMLHNYRSRQFHRP